MYEDILLKSLPDTMRDFTDGHILYEEGNYVFVPAYLFDVSFCRISHFGENARELTISFGWQDVIRNASYEAWVEDSNKDGLSHLNKIFEQIIEAFNIKGERFDPKPCILIIEKRNMIDVCGIEQFRALGSRKRIMFSRISEAKEIKDKI